ncbi:hypothetical protein ACQ4LE_009173 [Meloidogyne hapla]
MSFEHEQFQRFLQKENKQKYLKTNNYSSPIYSSPLTEKRLYTKISTKKSPRIYQQRTIIEYRNNEEENNFNEIKEEKNKNYSNQFLFPSKAKKLAMFLVCVKMLLLCFWLLYEIASDFDEGQCLAIKNEEKIILENLNNENKNNLKATANLQTIPINSDYSKIEGENQPKGVKRRRKVILRRRLLRKGGASSIVSKSIEDNKNNSKQKRGNSVSTSSAVRRVIWKIVPLRKLPDNEEDENNLINLNNEINPIKTKTAKVILKRIEEENREENREEKENNLIITEKQQRKMARRRTPNLNNLKKSEESKTSSEETISSPIYSALSFPEQLETFLGLSKCYARIIFDFWCLLQCFCSALFLLALYLKIKCLAITSICVDVISVVLAIIFGFSSLVFTLVLLLLPSNLPSKPILECFALTTLIHIAIALFAWITCIEMKVAKNELENKYEERENNKKFNNSPYSL